MDIETSSISDDYHEDDTITGSSNGRSKRKRFASGVPAAIAQSPNPKRKSKPNPKDTFNDSEKENSLGALTKRFVEIARQHADGILELNDIAEKLGVSKRRLYDITNVLEGINLVEKLGKNNIQWKAGSVPSGSDQQSRKSHEENIQCEKNLDSSILHCQSQIQQFLNSSRCYVSHNDVHKVSYLEGKMILAVKAAKGAQVAIDQTENQRLTLRSDSAVDVYVLTQPEPETSETASPEHDHNHSKSNNNNNNSHNLPGLSTPPPPNRRFSNGNEGLNMKELDQQIQSKLGPLSQIAASSSVASNFTPGNFASPNFSSPPFAPNSFTPTQNTLLLGQLPLLSAPVSPDGIRSLASVIPMDDHFMHHFADLSPERNSSLHKPVALLGSPSLLLSPSSPTPYLDESTQPGMVNIGALRSGSRSVLNEHSNGAASPFKSTSRNAHVAWGMATPEVTQGGFDDLMDRSTSPTKGASFLFSPNSSPEKRFGNTYGVNQEDTFHFLSETSLGMHTK